MTARRQIIRAASRLLADSKDPDLPVDVEAVAQGLGIAVVRDKFEPTISGVLIREASSTVIVVNLDHHSRRQRFTIAHELGHYELHPGRELTVDSSVRLNWRDDVAGLATDQEEIDANAFAAELLMPADAVRAAVASLRGELADPRKVSARLTARFDVSTEAMGYRLINLGIST